RTVMRILVVEDNSDLANSIATSIRQMEHAVDVIGDGLHAESMLHTEPYDLVVLDLNLPGKDGLEILKSLRGRGSDLPVLILTARAETESRVQGLDLGADDYLTKPFHLAELDARIRALLRRKQASASPVLKLGPLEFDTVSREARLNGEELPLTRRERGVLEVLISARKKVISKDKIAEHLFSFDDEVNVTAIELYIHRLRKKLDAPGIGIRTVRGLGYVLEVDE
ncbi:MAG: response regulator, partial [Candidatus Sedimenticola sp. 4PFRAG1]